MATITETCKTSETAPTPVTQSSTSTGRKKHEFRIRVVYCEFLPTNFYNKLRMIAIPFSKILNANRNMSSFVKDWVPSIVLLRVWTVIANFFQCWEIDESLIDALKEHFTNHSSDKVMCTIKSCLSFAEDDSPIDVLTLGQLKKVIKWAFASESSLTINLAFTGRLDPLVHKALESSLTLWQEIYPERLANGVEVESMIDELSAMVKNQIDRVLSSPEPPAKKPSATLPKETPDMPPQDARLNPAFSNAMGVTPSPPTSILHRAADGGDVYTTLRRFDAVCSKKASSEPILSNDRKGYIANHSPDVSDDRAFGHPNDHFGHDKIYAHIFSFFA